MSGDKRQFKTIDILYGAVIAGLYVALTYVSQFFGLASGAVQLRLSEALCILPVFTPAAIPGLTVGCVLANLFTGCAVPDVIFGSFATLLGAVFTYLLRKTNVFVAAVPPVISNVLIVPPILVFVYNETMAYPLIVLCVAAGEILSCVVLGGLLGLAIKKRKIIFKGAQKGDGKAITPGAGPSADAKDAPVEEDKQIKDSDETTICH